MARFRVSSLLAVTAIILCTLYWLQTTGWSDDGYTDPSHMPDEDRIMLLADGGGSKHRFVDSNSAGQYDVSRNELPELDKHKQKEISIEDIEKEARIAAQLEEGLEDDTTSSIYPDTTTAIDEDTLSSSPTSDPIDIVETSTTSLKATSLRASSTSLAFPRKIWQTSSFAGKDKYADKAQTWKDLNADYEYIWLSDDAADRFVYSNFSTTRPSIATFWEDLSMGLMGKNKFLDNSTDVDSTGSSAIVLRADLLRYLLMLSQGGIYSDIDTSTVKGADFWIPAHLKNKEINAVIGIEYDDTTYPMFVRPISFCQWTLAANPGHEIYARAVQRVMSNLEFLARRQRASSLSLLKLDKSEVLEGTGPGMISDVVLEVIQDQLPGEDITWATFHNQKEPKLFGDVLILPINGFAGSQKHSHAGDPAYGDKLVQHHFGRSWYAPKKAGTEAERKEKERLEKEKKTKQKEAEITAKTTSIID